MIALPKAISQGSNGGGGGALAAFKGISAAKAEPAVIASTAATKTIFFMTIPITFAKDQSSPTPPKGNTIPAATEFLNVIAIWSAAFVTGSKKD
jgi:hypothetical protein